MKDLKFKYLNIKFKDGTSKEFFMSNIEHIETNANSINFIVRIFIIDIKACSHMEEYIYEVNQIKEIEQRWEATDVLSNS